MPLTTLAGTVIRTDITISDCVGLFPVTTSQFVDFGPFPAGSYSYEVYLIYGNNAPVLDDVRTLVVTDAAAAVPLSRSAMVVLLAAIAAVATAVLHTRTG